MGRKIGKNCSDRMKRLRDNPVNSWWMANHSGLSKRQRKEIKRWKDHQNELTK